MIRASCACALAHFFKISVSPHHNSTRCDQDAQGHNAAHGENATGLPGICDVKFVSHTMGDSITPSAWSRGISKPEKPTQGAPPRRPRETSVLSELKLVGAGQFEST